MTFVPMLLKAIRLSEGIALRVDSISGPIGARRLQVTRNGNKDRSIPVQPGRESVLDRYLQSRADDLEHREGARAQDAALAGWAALAEQIAGS